MAAIAKIVERTTNCFQDKGPNAWNWNWVNKTIDVHGETERVGDFIRKIDIDGKARVAEFGGRSIGFQRGAVYIAGNCVDLEKSLVRKLRVGDASQEEKASGERTWGGQDPSMSCVD